MSDGEKELFEQGCLDVWVDGLVPCLKDIPMNGIEQLELPVFMQGEPLPDDYFEPQDPYKVAPSCKVNIRAMTEYAMQQGKRCWDLTKEEFAMFRVG